MDVQADLLHSWDLNHKVTLYLLDAIEPDWLPTKLGGRGRSIGEQFVHIHNIRSFWIGKVDRKVDLKLEKKHARDKEQLNAALKRSSQEMRETLSNVFEQESIKGYKPTPVAFFSQMIAHESHHRGQIMSTVATNGLPIDKSVNFGLWNWNNKG